MKPFYLIYHPERQIARIGNDNVYHDKFGGNEDPYIWNENFLHTFCHITQLSNEIGQVNFWVSGDSYPNFTQLLCDCVFVINDKCYWENSNSIESTSSIVDNNQVFEFHYNWVNKGHHLFIRRKRYTLKADTDLSFQPQNSKRELIDIIPFLNENGLSTKELIQKITSKRGSRPFRLNDVLGIMLYDYLLKEASIKFYGRQLKDKHPNYHEKIKTRCC